jgi:hypothetical protein
VLDAMDIGVGGGCNLLIVEWMFVRFFLVIYSLSEGVEVGNIFLDVFNFFIDGFVKLVYLFCLGLL